MLCCLRPARGSDPPIFQEIPLAELPPTFAALPPGFVPGHTPLIVVDRGQGPDPFYVPTIKQLELHLAAEKNVLYGGRAGTGKSVGLRMDGYIRCTLQPSYRALLVRRHMTELRDTHLDKVVVEAEAIGAIWRASESTILFPKTNSRFRFGHVEDNNALAQYLSSEFDIIYFDEGATFTEFQYRFLCSRLRTSSTGVKAGCIPMVRLGSNPGAMWLYDYYIAKDVDAERDPGYRAKDYYFIAATVDDNPHVDREEYNIRLNGLPSEALRRMYRDGDWLAVEGQFYPEFRPTRTITTDGDVPKVIPWHVTYEIPRHHGKPVLELPWIEIIRAIDWGYSEAEPGWCGWFAMLPDSTIFGFQEYLFRQTRPEDVALTIAKMSKWPDGKAMKVRYSVADPSMFAERTGESIAETFAKKKNGGISLLEGDNSHPTGFIRVHSWLKTEYNQGTGPYPAFQLLGPSPSHHFTGCPYAIKTASMLTEDLNDPSRIAKHQPDHAWDAIKYLVMHRPALTREPKASFAHLPPYIRKAIMRGHPTRQKLGVESVRR